MAARENQGYLIAVIVLVLLSLILALLAFLGWSSANENSDLLTAANQKARPQRCARRRSKSRSRHSQILHRH